MHAFTYFLPEARSLIRTVWSRDGARMAPQSVTWLYSEEGAEAYLKFVERILDATVQFDTQLRSRLEWFAREIFKLEAEIAARRSGVCPELESPPFDDAERAYRASANTDC